MLGLLTRARSAARAETMWAAVLQGRRDDAAGTLVYRWPGSPMRITVDLDAGADEGPIAVESTSARAVDLPAAPELGTMFRQSPR